MEDGKIYSTGWKVSVNQVAEFKHFYAHNKGKTFVAVATRTGSTRFFVLPLMRGTTIEYEHQPGAIHSDEAEARQKVVDWLKVQSSQV